MAKYNREFLVPYLQNICALHILEKEMNSDIQSADYRRSRCQRMLKERVHKPSYPTLYPATGEAGGCLLFLGGVLFVLMVIVFIGISSEGEWNPFYKGLFWVVGILLFLIAIIVAKEVNKAKEANESMLAEYDRELREAEEQQAYNIDYAKKNLPEAEASIQKWSAEVKTVSNLLTKLYDVNVIPAQYRNIYVAVYLYEWFSTSMADDLDHALSMFVLEEIKERLDRVIANQTEQIINQQLMIANQYRSQEMLQQHNEEMVSKLEQINASNEERNRYLGMIEGNTAAIAYFSAAEYFSN